MSHKESREKSTIQRCPHDKENPYAQISRALIRDDSISPNCRMVLISLLSNDDKSWVIRPTQLYNQFKKHIGRDAIYKIINEAIEAGYIMREQYLEGGFLRYKYYLSEEPKFKKCLLYPESQYTENPYTENQGTKERTYEEKQSNKKENIKESKNPIVHNSSLHKAPVKSIVPPSASAAQASIPFQRKDKEIDFASDDLADLLEMESQYSPYFRSNIVIRWVKKFGPKFVLDTIKFFFHIKSTQKKPIPNCEAWMEIALAKNYAKIDKACQENKLFAEDFKKKHGLSSLKINKRYCQDTQTEKDFYYNLPKETFIRALTELYER